MVLGHQSAVQRLQTISALYPATADVAAAIVEDFHSVRQALNVASADQRVYVLVHGTRDQMAPLRKSLREVANHKELVGRFHFDFDEGDQWKKTISGLSDGPGISIIQPGEFGMDGKMMQQLPLDTANAEIIRALTQANSEFAKKTDKKVYSYHVSKGRDLGIYFEGAVPYGEDRDGDGEIDHGGESRGGRSRPRGAGSSSR